MQIQPPRSRLVLLVLLCLAGCLVVQTQAQMPDWAFPCKFQVLSHQKRAGLTTLQASFSINRDNIASVHIQLTGTKGIEFPGESTWQMDVQKEETYSKQFDVLVPDSDTSMISMLFTWGQRSEKHRYWFVTTGDTIEFWRGNPRGVAPKDPPWGWSKKGFLNSKEFPDQAKRYGSPIVEPISLPALSGTAELRLTFAPEEKTCDSIRVVCVGTNRLKAVGDSLWVAPVDLSRPYSRDFQIDIPPNDTSSLFVTIYCAEWFAQTRHFFVNTRDTLEYYPKNPWGHEPVQWFEGKVRPAGKRTKSWTIMTMADLRKLEDKPLLDSAHEAYNVNGVVYMRRRGQTTFYEPPSHTDGDAYRRKLRDSAAAMSLTTWYDATIHVCDSGQLSFAKSLIDSLVPEGTHEGCQMFRCRTTKAALIKLNDRGIRISFDELDPVVDSAPYPPMKLNVLPSSDKATPGH